MGKDFPSFGKELYSFAVKKNMGAETISRIAHLNESDSHKLNNELFTNLLVDSIKTYKNPNYSATNSLSLFFEEVFKLMISEAQDSRINYINSLRGHINDNPDMVKELEDHITKLNAKEIEPSLHIDIDSTESPFECLNLILFLITGSLTKQRLKLTIKTGDAYRPSSDFSLIWNRYNLLRDVLNLFEGKLTISTGVAAKPHFGISGNVSISYCCDGLNL